MMIRFYIGGLGEILVTPNLCSRRVESLKTSYSKTEGLTDEIIKERIHGLFTELILKVETDCSIFADDIEDLKIKLIRVLIYRNDYTLGKKLLSNRIDINYMENTY